jgi:predicted ribosome quality control (RQC) complex YloA/Tae2 family protein
MLTLARRLHARSERRLKALVEDHHAAQQAESHRLAGNAILANLGALVPGTGRATLTDFEGNAIEIILDPNLSATDNARRYFKKYKKAKGGQEIIARRIRDTRDEALFLKNIESELAGTTDTGSLTMVRDRLVELGYIEMVRPKQDPVVSAPYRTILHRGWEILIGKNAAGNDLLSTRVARTHDLWLHAEGIPGSHVVVKNPDKREIPPEIVEKAARVAAFYSKGRHATKVPVTYTFARFVKKPKGAKPGMVVLSERKTVMAVPDAGQRDA